jgi:hypothetical protein
MRWTIATARIATAEGVLSDSTPSVPPPSVRFLAWGFEKNPNIRDTAVDFTTSGY